MFQVRVPSNSSRKVVAILRNFVAVLILDNVAIKL